MKAAGGLVGGAMMLAVLLMRTSYTTGNAALCSGQQAKASGLAAVGKQKRGFRLPLSQRNRVEVRQ